MCRVRPGLTATDRPQAAWETISARLQAVVEGHPQAAAPIARRAAAPVGVVLAEAASGEAAEAAPVGAALAAAVSAVDIANQKERSQDLSFYSFLFVQQPLPIRRIPSGGVKNGTDGLTHVLQLVDNGGRLHQRPGEILTGHDILHDPRTILAAVGAGIVIHKIDILAVGAEECPPV